MAMLAEPHRKQKWSVDPRNRTQSKDESKFGQKMLEKMGWFKGKGLGDNWIAHQDDSNQILAELNNRHLTTSSEVPSDDEKKSFSLEEYDGPLMPHGHRSGLHFWKTKEPEAPSEEQDERQNPTKELEAGNTVTSTLSVNEYFAKYMAELKKSHSHRSQSSPRKVEECLADSTESPPKDVNTNKSKKKGWVYPRRLSWMTRTPNASGREKNTTKRKSQMKIK
uniref:G-patch domain-containing protein n=1 Tax=Leptobrachium leishanense TaxID=445787 RepID=A0A8C5PD84_9ANUR